MQHFRCRGYKSSQEQVAVVQAGDDQHLDPELHPVPCEERQDPDVVEGNLKDCAAAEILGARDSWLSSITPRFLAVTEGDTVTSSTLTDKSLRWQSFPGMKRSLVL